MSPSIIASGVVVEEYKMDYRTAEAGEGKDHWAEKRTGRKTEFYAIEGLTPQTAYRIRVSAVCDNGALSIPSEEVEVSTSLEEEDADNVARQFLQESSLVEDRQPLVFALPLAKVPLDTPCLMYQLGKENLEVPNKVILVMGATGCGKTTLINGMINYILGVQWEDNFRFKLIHETTWRSGAGSRTSDVTAYAVHHRKGFQIPYSLTIIDTPGFVGRRDAAQDKRVEKQLLELFSAPGGIDHVDAICFVAQAFLTHSTQKCVFDSVLSTLGKDTKENIQLLITFSDGGTPPVLETVQKADVPYARDKTGIPLHFGFNNSALFAHRENGGSRNAAAEMFWKLSAESTKDFFDSLKTLERKSLTLTVEVLKERQTLDIALETLRTTLRASLMNVEELEKMQEALQQCKENIVASQNFEFEVETSVNDIISANVMYCPSCSTICHSKCELCTIAHVHRCDVMHSDGYCTTCPGKCSPESHQFRNSYVKTQMVREKKVHEALKRNYDEAKAKEKSLEKNLEQNFQRMKLDVKTVLDRCSRCLENLREVALKPIPRSMLEDPDLGLLSEGRALESGPQERIQVLKKMGSLIEILQTFATSI